MPALKPTFSLTIGGLRSTTENAAGGPRSFLVERDIGIPADALQIELADRAKIALGEDITLELGHDGENSVVFTGQVVHLRPAISGVTVYALGPMNKLLNL